MTSPQPFPNAGQSQPSSPGTEMSPYADMMGVQQGGAVTNNAEQLRKQQQENTAMQVRSMTQQLDGLARQYPGAAQEILAVQRALTRIQVKITSSMQSESQAPTGSMG